MKAIERAWLGLQERYVSAWPFFNGLGLMALFGFWLLAPTGGFDARNFHAVSLEAPYRAAWHTAGSFVYSPAFAQAIWPLTLLPPDVFEKLWLAINITCLGWLLRPFWAGLALAFLPVQSELLTGQIHVMLAVAIVLSMRWSVAWTFVLLTKVTPGVGMLWYAVRREWRAFGQALGMTTGVVIVSALVWPGAWYEWLAVLTASPDQPADYVLTHAPLAWRVGAAIVLTVLAASMNRPAALPFIVLLALPAVWFSALTLLAAVPRLASPKRSDEGAAASMPLAIRRATLRAGEEFR